MVIKRGDNIFSSGKKGQVTIFIIIAVVVVALGVLIYFLRSGAITQVISGFDAKNPNGFLQTCIEGDLKKTVDTISSQGGSLRPGHYIAYQGNNIEYLCYTGEYYKTCSVQQPLLKAHIESEIENATKGKVVSCFDELRSAYESKGYTVNMVSGPVSVELLPKRVVTRANYVFTVTKGDSSRYDSFNVVLNNNLYELISIANSIVAWETRYGDAETTLYMSYYPDLKVEKKNQQDGSTIYILTDRNQGNKFQFASRSVAWPPGYGIEGISAG